jgi:hypothetical protein
MWRFFGFIFLTKREIFEWLTVLMVRYLLSSEALIIFLPQEKAYLTSSFDYPMPRHTAISIQLVWRWSTLPEIRGCKKL